MDSTLGIYFGLEIISITETKSRKLINNVQIPQKTITSSELEEIVPDDIKMVALFKDEMRKNNIAAKDVSLALSGKDLIIRTFEMPLMPREELAHYAINFEARKYIPFKVEELILDYQLYFDKTTRKNLVLLVGIKKETLDKYLSVFHQLNLKIISIEYAAFSVLRLLKLSGLRYKGVAGVVYVDIHEMDEVNFMVLESGFPLFSRDIILREGPIEIPGNEGVSSGAAALEKLKTEIRISLDYYHRKFPLKKIDKMFFISSRDYQSDLEMLAKDAGLNTEFIDVERCIGKAVPFSLSFLKGYSSALSKVIKIFPKIDLLSAKTRQVKEQAKKISVPSEAIVSMFKGLSIWLPILILVLLCIAAFAFGIFQKLPIQKELNNVRALRPPVSTVNPEASYEELTNRDSEYKRKLDTLDNLIKKQLYLTFPLNVIPGVIPKGVWLQNFSFEKEEGQDKAELVLRGMAYLADSDKEFTMINKFFTDLKENPEFNKYFKELTIVFLDRGVVDKLMVTNFSISCKTSQKKE